MKTLTVRQPWADQIITGRKTVENRGALWRHRGPLGIHAATLPHPDHPDLPCGVILGVVTLTAAHPGHGCRCHPTADPGARAHLVLADPRPLPRPVPTRGRPGLWDTDIPDPAPAA